MGDRKLPQSPARGWVLSDIPSSYPRQPGDYCFLCLHGKTPSLIILFPDSSRIISLARSNYCVSYPLARSILLAPRAPSDRLVDRYKTSLRGWRQNTCLELFILCQQPFTHRLCSKTTYLSMRSILEPMPSGLLCLLLGLTRRGLCTR